MIFRACIFCLDMTESKNYIDKDGNNPYPGMAINGEDVVLNKEHLTGDKWLFINNDPLIYEKACEQIIELKRCNDWIGITE